MTPRSRLARTKVDIGERAPQSPDESTQRAQVRHFLSALMVACVAGSASAATLAWATGSPRLFAEAILVGLLAAWITAFPRREIGRGHVESIVKRVAFMLMAVILAAALILPTMALVLATAVLIPIAAVLPFLDVRSLRRTMVIAFLAIVTTIAVGFLPSDEAASGAVTDFTRLYALAIVMCLVAFLLYQSTRRLIASGTEFRRLFQLSSDLAETTEAAVLGALVARHLAEATGFDDCVIYALSADTSRLVPFGSYPVERSLITNPESIADRPILGLVLHDRERIVIDVADKTSESAEQVRLRALDRAVMLLLPLVALSDPVGVAELTAHDHRPLDERRLALAQTLAFEAAMAIENGRLYQELRHRALHDALTGLANWGLFRDRLDHALTRQSRREGAFVAVLFIDLDDFKSVSDTRGHARGDRLLALLAERLCAVVRPGDTVARLGGDEFALLLEDLADDDEALAVAERAVEAVAAPFDLAGQPVSVGISIGVAVRSAAGVTGDELIQEADAAMYQAKRAGKGRAVRFRADLHGPPEAIGGRPDPAALVKTA